MAVRTYAIESATYRAGAEIEKNILRLEGEGVDHQEAHLKGVEEYAIECSIVKVLGSETIQFCSDEGIQIYGGMGYSADAPQWKQPTVMQELQESMKGQTKSIECYWWE